MADLDSRSKRASSVQMLVPSLVAPPLPDGSIDVQDRSHIAWNYSGTIFTFSAVADLMASGGYVGRKYV